MRKLCLFLLALLAATLPSSAYADGNLLKNGDFSELLGSLPADWTRDMWYTDAGLSELTVESDGWDGACIRIVNNSENDARFAQTVTVDPDTTYRISCMCKAEGIGEGGIGATISVEGTFTYSEQLYDTQGEWVSLELYGQTGTNQTELTVFARVGGYGYLNTGTAWFDDFQMEAVENAPSGIAVGSFDPSSIASSNEKDDDDKVQAPARNTQALLLLTCLWALAVVACARKYGRTPAREDKVYRGWLAVILAAAFILRAALAVRFRGYNTDINCFTSWSENIFSVGAGNFYNAVWCDYPPGYMLMLMPVAFIRRMLNLQTDSGAYLLLLKLIPILFDLAGMWLLWRCEKRRLGARTALMLAAFYAFNPAVFTDSAAWGQIDSVFTLLIALCALEATEERYSRSLICFAAAVLIKPQALLFAPLGLFAVIVFCMRSKRSDCWKLLMLGIASALSLMYIVAAPFSWDSSLSIAECIVQPFRWLYELYGSTMTGYRYVVVNALNVYYLFGLNWNNAELHTAAMTVAWLLFALSYVYSFVLCALSHDRKHLTLIGGVLIVLIYTFGPMIHERYVFPALLLLALAYGATRDKRLLISLTVLSATLFINEFLVLQGGMTEANYGHLQSDENWLNYTVSVINVLNALFLSCTAFDICALGRVYPTKDAPIERQVDPFSRRGHRMRLTRRDAMIMAAVTAVYAVAAFVNLGSTKAPQTAWVSGSSGEQVVFDLGQTRRFRMTYYGGICNSNFTVELSNDGIVWTEPYYANYDQGEIFRWLFYVPQTAEAANAAGPTLPTDDGSAYVAFSGYEGETYPFQTARYVRIASVAAGLNLFEVAFLNEDGEVLPIESVRAGDIAPVNDYTLLVDEQDTVPEHPSYYNSTYFDEIYHARTAYEHLHGLSTYEWTHPPLGKVLMMVGIQLFGMTPFGWRFMGALTGVLMLPLMYLLVKQLTKSTPLSVVAMGLLSLDSMHFTQTRIATIDSYAVFWIMLMYLFMIRYSQMRWTTKSDFLRSLVTLGLCGVTMGIAWATKWIGLYASAGLAILFFWTLWRHSREKAEHLPRRALITLAFCLVFFIAIPLLIYYFSYYWHLQSQGVTCLKDMLSMQNVKSVVKLQQRIFDYHAGLSGDTHYFRSPWYQWPIIWWPMWYYSGTVYLQQGMISSISCMGNPAVWWFGLFALLFVIIRMAWLRRAPRTYTITAIGFASQFLPWVLVPRSTFIYHYFASVPFIIIASVLALDRLRVRRPALDGSAGEGVDRFAIAATLLLTAAFVLFVMFYPLESGLPVARSYANCLRWFKWHNF